MRANIVACFIFPIYAFNQAVREDLTDMSASVVGQEAEEEFELLPTLFGIEDENCHYYETNGDEIFVPVPSKPVVPKRGGKEWRCAMIKQRLLDQNEQRAKLRLRKDLDQIDKEIQGTQGQHDALDCDGAREKKYKQEKVLFKNCKSGCLNAVAGWKVRVKEETAKAVQLERGAARLGELLYTEGGGLRFQVSKISQVWHEVREDLRSFREAIEEEKKKISQPVDRNYHGQLSYHRPNGYTGSLNECIDEIAAIKKVAEGQRDRMWDVEKPIYLAKCTR